MELPAGYIERKLANRERAAGEPRSFREKLYLDFKTKLNPGRVDDGFPELTDSRLGKLFKGMPDSAVEGLYKACNEAESFSRLFWWKLKQGKEITRTTTTK